MERDRSKAGSEPVRRAEERGRWRDAAQREREGVETAGDRKEAERMERDRTERERMDRERSERERMERDRLERERRERMERGELAGRGIGGTPLAPRDPWIASHFDFMRQFMDEMSRMFGGWGYPGRTGSAAAQGLAAYPGQSGYQGITPYHGSSLSGWPPIEVEERDGRMLIRAELPGMDMDDVRVCLEGNYLLIEGERRDERKREHEGYYESEFSYGHFSRRIPMPSGLTPDQIHATCQKGVLELTVDIPSRNVREIPIRTERAGREERVDDRFSERERRESPPARTEH